MPRPEQPAQRHDVTLHIPALDALVALLSRVVQLTEITAKITAANKALEQATTDLQAGVAANQPPTPAK